MRTYRNFDEALEDFRAGGGAMMVVPPVSRQADCTWHVGEWAEINDASDGDPRQATKRALVAGGLCDDDVDAEMAEWND